MRMEAAAAQTMATPQAAQVPHAQAQVHASTGFVKFLKDVVAGTIGG